MPLAVAVSISVLLVHATVSVGVFCVITGFELTVSVPLADDETQPAALVTITLYVPPTVLVKLATLPGLVKPAGTVHTYV